MSSSVRCASAASTSSCMPLTISAIRSASARAACSRSSASRSPPGAGARRRRAGSLPPTTSPRASPARLRFRREAGAVAALELELEGSRTVRLPVEELAPARVVAVAPLGRDDQGAHGLPIASAGGQPNMRSAAAFQARMIPSRSRVMNASGRAVEHQAGARLTLLEERLAMVGLGAGAAQRPIRREISRPATRRGHRQQPADRGARGSWSPSTTA